MDKSNVLLSQSEIDALLDFLTEKKVSSSIMDQDSIDKLIDLLQSGEGSKFRFDELLDSQNDSDSTVIILPGNINISDPDGTVLSFRINADDCAEVVCKASNGEEYLITPDMVQKIKYMANSKSYWGRSVSPVIFDSIARLLNAKYTKKTYLDVCTRYAAVNYPATGMSIAPLYLPSEESLVERMIED